MYVLVRKCILFSSLLFVGFCFIFSSALAKNNSPTVKLYSPYSEISVSPGQTIMYTVQVINNSDSIQTIDLSVIGLPRRWNYMLKSGNWDISRVSILPKKNQVLYLTVKVPLRVNKGVYRFDMKARGFTVMPLTVVVTKKGTYKTALTTTQSSLEGTSSSTFTFNATLQNATADTQLYALNAETPPGWNVTFKANYKEVASVSVNANQTQNITITVNPPDQVPAGTYKIPVIVSANGTSAGLDLEVTVTGSYAMELTTPTGLLSTNITAGGHRRLKLVVKNTGSAPLNKVTFDYSAPNNWDVTFDPKQIDMIPAGGAATTYATIKADKNSIAGDYATDLEAKTPETSSKAEFRITVQTPMLWGWIGVLVILIALGSVYFLFRKYGRR